MITVGTIMGDRYEILEKIGTGGMSDVYKAKDNKLNRYVAIKVLKSEFSENTNFVSKFRVEAQAAARLTHPNIVNVYDVGEEGDTHYIVMELVEGITLKNYIEKKARLSVKEAISIAIQVSMGIEAAHNNHIIHRDIKPQNIMISKEGKVKIADFGIAKAATSNTITSNVMGSVHYTSPEQARGGFSDERSDIYSLGCTMYEMLTGRVPFDGETTVAIAIKHIQEEMPSPRDFVSEIPVCVEQIIYKSTQKSPDRRYQSMSELIVDLKKSLITPNENFVKIIEADTGGATKTISEEDLEQIKRQTGNIYLGRVTEDEPELIEEEEEEEIYEPRAYRSSSEPGPYDDEEEDDYPDYETEQDIEEELEEEIEEELEEDDDYPDEEDEEEARQEEIRRQRERERRRREAEQQRKAAEQKRLRELEKKREIERRKQNKAKKRAAAYDDDADEKMEKITTVLAIVAAVIIGILALVIVGYLLGIFGKKKTPDIVDSSADTGFVTDVTAGDETTDDAQTEEPTPANDENAV
ncbi:MAG: Stk1 family PASTA domain-containing Ser/Thr kinase, partial [Lachnospiraceae bacterium]|nr:Stk1 family PASTA domain-containing Ser/Thr kinase [Lachnospiraceae bacterium]